MWCEHTWVPQENPAVEQVGLKRVVGLVACIFFSSSQLTAPTLPTSSWKCLFELPCLLMSSQLITPQRRLKACDACFFFSNSWIFCFLLTYSVGESLGFFFTCNLSTEIRLNPSHNIFTHVGKQSDDRFYTTKTKGGLLNSSHITWNINSNENTIDNSYQ